MKLSWLAPQSPGTDPVRGQSRFCCRDVGEIVFSPPGMKKSQDGLFHQLSILKIVRGGAGRSQGRHAGRASELFRIGKGEIKKI